MLRTNARPVHPNDQAQASGETGETPIGWRGQLTNGPRYPRSLLVLNVAIGALLLTAVVGAAARRRRPPRSQGLHLVGWSLVLVPLPLAVALHLLLSLPVVVDEVIFGVGAVAFAVGAFLLLGRDDGDADESPDDDADPPWWPAFERQLRIYSTTRPRRPDRLARS